MTQNDPGHPRGGPHDRIPPDPGEPATHAADDIERQEEALLDEAIELTFPASDPISVPSYEEAIERSKSRKDHHVTPPAS